MTLVLRNRNLSSLFFQLPTNNPFHSNFRSSILIKIVSCVRVFSSFNVINISSVSMCDARIYISRTGTTVSHCYCWFRHKFLHREKKQKKLFLWISRINLNFFCCCFFFLFYFRIFLIFILLVRTQKFVARRWTWCYWVNDQSFNIRWIHKGWKCYGTRSAWVGSLI